jgi:GTP-binding protein
MQKLRNIAIIAHVDHGKTTLVDKLIHAGDVFEKHVALGELIMDNGDLEKERGITITSKNLSLRYGEYKVNIIDTPGHADFGGEVERVLNMTDGVILLVDAFEGPMPQTRFVLQKAIELDLKIIVVINKVDKENCNPEKVHEDVFELMFELNASEEQLNFPTIYGSAKQGWMDTDWIKHGDNIKPLMDCIIEHIPESKPIEGNKQMLITAIDHSNYIGRIAIGKVHRGTLRENDMVALMSRDGSIKKSRIKELFIIEGLVRQKVSEVQSGEICAVSGIENFDIGDTITDAEFPEAMKSMAIDEPTMSMVFTINNSPFFGKEGKYVTSRHIRDRLFKEVERNLALRVEDSDSADSFIVYGRGVLHLSILIETMRREGYELQIGQPQVLIKEIDGKKCEPFEELLIDLPEDMAGKAIDIVTQRKGEMLSMEARGTRTILKFSIPARGIIGMRNQMLTATAGEAIMSHRFHDYQPVLGDIPRRINGSLISMETGSAIPFSLNNLQDRGKFFVAPNTPIYEGQVIGEHSRQNDLTVNVTKTKKLSNMRSSGNDEKVKLAPPIIFSLEEALEYIQGDEYVEVTPLSIRLRKIYLKEFERKRNPIKA